MKATTRGGGRRKDTCDEVVQNAAEGKTSHALSWKVQMIRYWYEFGKKNMPGIFSTKAGSEWSAEIGGSVRLRFSLWAPG